MELTGDEKRIQALFSELSYEDAQNAPRFEKLWREAALAAPTPRLRKSLVVVVAASLIVAVTVLFVAWSRDNSPKENNAKLAVPQPIPNDPAPQTPQRDESSIVQRRTSSHATRRRTLARRQRSERALEQQAALLASWKSPTENFVTSPTSSAFDSLPQLNEAAKDLQSFLGKKESNQ
jgi:hypothetical protein